MCGIVYIGHIVTARAWFIEAGNGVARTAAFQERLTSLGMGRKPKHRTTPMYDVVPNQAAAFWGVCL